MSAYERDQLVESNKALNDEVLFLKKELNKALDALSVTQEEWYLRVKNLEVNNYDLKEAVGLAKESMRFTYYAIQNQIQLSDHTVASLIKSKELLDKSLIKIEELTK